MKCTKCNSEMFYKENGRTAVWTCPNCGYSLASGIVYEIDRDQQIYQLSVNPIENPDIVVMRELSKMSGLNFIQLKEVLKNGNLNWKGNAKEIKKYRDQLENSKITYTIEPNFPY